MTSSHSARDLDTKDRVRISILLVDIDSAGISQRTKPLRQLVAKLGVPSCDPNECALSMQRLAAKISFQNQGGSIHREKCDEFSHPIIWESTLEKEMLPYQSTMLACVLEQIESMGVTDALSGPEADLRDLESHLDLFFASLHISQQKK